MGDVTLAVEVTQEINTTQNCLLRPQWRSEARNYTLISYTRATVDVYKKN